MFSRKISPRTRSCAAQLWSKVRWKVTIIVRSTVGLATKSDLLGLISSELAAPKNSEISGQRQLSINFQFCDVLKQIGPKSLNFEGWAPPKSVFNSAFGVGAVRQTCERRKHFLCIWEQNAIKWPLRVRIVLGPFHFSWLICLMGKSTEVSPKTVGNGHFAQQTSTWILLRPCWTEVLAVTAFFLFVFFSTFHFSSARRVSLSTTSDIASDTRGQLCDMIWRICNIMDNEMDFKNNSKDWICNPIF